MPDHTLTQRAVAQLPDPIACDDAHDYTDVDTMEVTVRLSYPSGLSDTPEDIEFTHEVMGP